jgi:hypothetical protein
MLELGWKLVKKTQIGRLWNVTPENLWTSIEKLLGYRATIPV